VREVKDAKRAVDDRQAGRNQREKRAEHQPIETLRYEGFPVDHFLPASTPLDSLSYGHDASYHETAIRQLMSEVARCRRRDARFAPGGRFAEA
jgi:hypothetical protein